MSQHKLAAEMDKKTQLEKRRRSERGCHRVTWHTGFEKWSQRLRILDATHWTGCGSIWVGYNTQQQQQQQHVLAALSADDTNTCSVRLFSCTWFSLLMVNNNKTICAKRLQMQFVGLPTRTSFGEMKLCCEKDKRMFALICLVTYRYHLFSFDELPNSTNPNRPRSFSTKSVPIPFHCHHISCYVI